MMQSNNFTTPPLPMELSSTEGHPLPPLMETLKRTKEGKTVSYNETVLLKTVLCCMSFITIYTYLFRSELVNFGSVLGIFQVPSTAKARGGML